ncbi:MAG: Acetyltransferase, including N-acetylase of ribosomal protein [Anaerocolumna sp.]|jgi:ribosomal-protein-alanine N-acetyltransferase|nr:Acetyltransferase, including N-acetylase of ribosomal protein [Anaerocolumna sp.]
MTHKGTVIIETERLILRRFTIDDLEQIFNNCWSDFNVWKWTSYKPMKSVQDVIHIAEMFTDGWLGAYERPNRYSWAIVHKASGEVIGRFFGMHPDDSVSQIEFAYELGQNWWNQGLMTEAVKVVIDFFLKEVGINRIYANHASENPASGKVMQKCGMTYEGTMRQALRCNNGLFDKVNYAILADEYFK